MLKRLLLIASTLAQPVQLVDISYAEGSAQGQESVRFSANDVLLIDVATGQRAVVQFTRVGTGQGTYRWRYRRSKSSPVRTGVGEVAEKHERIPEGTGFRILPLPGNDTIVRAGEIRAEWSTHDSRSGYSTTIPSALG